MIEATNLRFDVLVLIEYELWKRNLETKGKCCNFDATQWLELIKATTIRTTQELVLCKCTCELEFSPHLAI